MVGPQASRNRSIGSPPPGSGYRTGRIDPRAGLARPAASVARDPPPAGAGPIQRGSRASIGSRSGWRGTRPGCSESCSSQSQRQTCAASVFGRGRSCDPPAGCRPCRGPPVRDRVGRRRHPGDPATHDHEPMHDATSGRGRSRMPSGRTIGRDDRDVVLADGFRRPLRDGRSTLPRQVGHRLFAA